MVAAKPANLEVGDNQHAPIGVTLQAIEKTDRSRLAIRRD